jgi:hypothetical protein
VVTTPAETDRLIEWVVDGRVVGTGTTFAPQPGDVGKALMARVTASKVGHLDAVAHTAPVQIRPAPPVGCTADTRTTCVLNGSSFAGALEPRTTVQQWVKYTAGEAGTYTFRSTTTPVTADVYGHLYDASGRQLTANDDAGGNYDFRLSYDLTAGQVVYLAIRNYSAFWPASPTSYTLHVSVTPLVVASCADNTSTQCEVTGSTITGTLPPGDTTQQWVRFVAPSLGIYTFRSSTNPVPADVVGHLYDSSGRLLTTNDDGGGNYDFRINRLLTSGQTVYLAIRHYTPSTPTPTAYTLTITR